MKREKEEEPRQGAIVGLQQNTCLLDPAGITMSPELTAFMTLFHVLTAHSFKRRGVAVGAHSDTYTQHHAVSKRHIYPQRQQMCDRVDSLLLLFLVFFFHLPELQLTPAPSLLRLMLMYLRMEPGPA